MLIRNLPALIATVTCSLAAGLDKSAMNNILPEFNSLSTVAANGLANPSKRADSHEGNDRYESGRQAEISNTRHKSIAQQQLDIAMRFAVEPVAEALISSLTSSQSTNLYIDSNEHRDQTIPQLARDNSDISSATIASDTNGYLPHLSSASVFSSTLTSAANMLSGPSTSPLSSFSTQPSSTVLPMIESSNFTQNTEVGINGTDPFAAVNDIRIMALPIEIQFLMCLLYGTLAFTAIASNTIVCYIVLSNQRMRTATNYFIVNLAVGDILMAALCIPFTFPANLIFQYWPFGLSLCVIVSYSQANSVFISAYTMVAISIDKYLAIMYPMRVRMSKAQAKIIILVIWSAALMTSLPTALLSSLANASEPAPAGPTTPSTIENISLATQAANQASSLLSTSTLALENLTADSSVNSQPSAQIESTTNIVTAISTDLNNSTKLSEFSHQSASSTSSSIAQTHQEQRPFCQESWSFWPPGKYYYSMALMILQFAIPLFVLVITYSRIVIVVWGKRMPGEEDNARDTRMARSKRKMIKMVISCVIAFALTWLPFNALIIMGDVRPDVWERADIMYIWFITHYLAMCHTVTNPLIYIWMNNRFRAGFKQVIGDLYRLLKQVTTYLFCYCLCLACLLSCSRKRYSRIAQTDRKRHLSQLTGRKLTASVSARLNSHRCKGADYLNYTGTTSTSPNADQQTGANRTVSSGPILTAASSTSANVDRNRQNTVVAIGKFEQIESRAAKLAENSGTKSNEVGLISAFRSQRGRQSSTEVIHPANYREVIQDSTRTKGNNNTPSNAPTTSRESGLSSAASKVVGRAARSLRQIKMFRVRQANGRESSSEQREKPQQQLSQIGNDLESSNRVVKKRHRKSKPDKISIQMTAIEFKPRPDKTIGEIRDHAETSCDRGEQHKACKKRSGWIGPKKVSESACPSCRLEATNKKNQANRSLAKMKREGHFSVDMRRGSHSTATLSLQTNMTGVPLSPLNSVKECNNNSTSVSSSSGGKVSFTKMNDSFRSKDATFAIPEAELQEETPNREADFVAMQHRKSSASSFCGRRRHSNRSGEGLSFVDESMSNRSGSFQAADETCDINYQASPNSSSMSLNQMNQAITANGSSCDDSSKDQYCSKHREKSMSLVPDTVMTEDTHGTDDDVFDVFLEKMHQTGSIGSLEFASYDKYDELEESRNLIAEYGDNGALNKYSTRLEAFKMSSFDQKEKDNNRDSVPSFVSARSPFKSKLNSQLLNRLFKSTNDDLHRNKVLSSDILTCRRSTVQNRNLARRFTNAGTQMNQQVDLPQQRSDKIRIGSTQPSTDGAAISRHLCSPRDRSLRRTMLLNNHLMLSSNASKIEATSEKDLAQTSMVGKLMLLNSSKAMDDDEEKWISQPGAQKGLVFNNSGRKTCNSSPASSPNHSSVTVTNQSSSEPAFRTTNGSIRPLAVAREFIARGNHEFLGPIPSTNGGGQIDSLGITQVNSNVSSATDGRFKSLSAAQSSSSKHPNDECSVRLGDGDEEEQLIDNAALGLVVCKSPTVYLINRAVLQAAASNESMEALV